MVDLFARQNIANYWYKDLINNPCLRYRLLLCLTRGKLADIDNVVSLLHLRILIGPVQR